MILDLLHFYEFLAYVVGMVFFCFLVPMAALVTVLPGCWGWWRAPNPRYRRRA
jgi:hypothetical protein